MLPELNMLDNKNGVKDAIITDTVNKVLHLSSQPAKLHNVLSVSDLDSESTKRLMRRVADSGDTSAVIHCAEYFHYDLSESDYEVVIRSLSHAKNDQACDMLVNFIAQLTDNDPEYMEALAHSIFASRLLWIERNTVTRTYFDKLMGRFAMHLKDPVNVILGAISRKDLYQLQIATRGSFALGASKNLKEIWQAAFIGGDDSVLKQLTGTPHYGISSLLRADAHQHLESGSSLLPRFHIALRFYSATPDSEFDMMLVKALAEHSDDRQYLDIMKLLMDNGVAKSALLTRHFFDTSPRYDVEVLRLAILNNHFWLAEIIISSGRLSHFSLLQTYRWMSNFTDGKVLTKCFRAVLYATYPVLGKLHQKGRVFQRLEDGMPHPDLMTSEGLSEACKLVIEGNYSDAVEIFNDSKETHNISLGDPVPAAVESTKNIVFVLLSLFNEKSKQSPTGSYELSESEKIFWRSRFSFLANFTGHDLEDFSVLFGRLLPLMEEGCHLQQYVRQRMQLASE